MLVAVVVLCTLENDVIHAAYLAIALLLFRRRDALRSSSEPSIAWLPHAVRGCSSAVKLLHDYNWQWTIDYMPSPQYLCLNMLWCS